MIYNNLFANLSAGQLIVTPNKRLARYLTKCYVQYTQAKVGLAPNIMAWQDYLTSIFTEAWYAASTNLPQVYSDFESKYLWEKLVVEHFQESQLLNLQSVSKQSYQAWELVRAWDLELDSVQLAEHRESCEFVTIAHKYLAHCKEQNMIATNQIASTLCKLGKLPRLKYNKVILCGFDEINPAQEKMLNFLKQQINIIVYHPQQQHTPTVLRYEFQESEAECAAAALYLQDNYQEHNVAICVPNLTHQRELLDETLQKYFAREDYNLSGGTALAREPIVASIILLLKLLMRRKISFGEVKKILQSPYYLGGNPLLMAKAHVLKELESRLQQEVSLQELIKLFTLYNIPYQEKLLHATKMQGASHIHKLENILQQLDLIEHITLSSREYQALDKFKTVLKSILALHPNLRAQQDFSAFVKLLEKALFDCLFEIETDAPKVQVLGVLEAAGQEFDKLWILNLSAHTWPGMVKYNAFLPITVQRKYNMPHSSAERELEFSQKIQQRLINSTSKEVMLTSHQSSQDQKIMQSPLIKDYPCANYQNHTPKKTAAIISKTNWIDDSKGTPVKVQNLKGLVRFLDLQAKCPFRAFMVMRLRAKNIELYQGGLPLYEQGIVVHRALELIWNKLQAQAALRALTHNERVILCTASIEQALEERKAQLPYIYTQGQIALEKARLLALILDWLEVEEERAEFGVAATELEMLAQVGKFSAKIKIDRIDKLATGELVLIDYKTGNVNIRDWFAARIQSPQMLLYLLQSSAALGLAFGLLHSKEVGFKGVAQQTYFTGLKELHTILQDCTWEQWLKIIKGKLEGLAQEIEQGAAQVTPINKQVCMSCNLQMVCRIYESS